MSGHTPGPWSVGDNSGNDGEAEGIVTTDRTICWTADTWDEDENDGVITDEDRANARLIAAAPELLAALKRVVSEANCAMDYSGVDDEHTLKRALERISKAKCVCEAAINKAEGRGE